MFIQGSGIYELITKTDQKALYVIIGKNIRNKRKESSLTQSDIAKQLQVTTQQVQKYETGKSAMYVHTLIDLSKIFNTSIESLVHEEIQTEMKVGKYKFVRDGFVDEDDDDSHE